LAEVSVLQLTRNDFKSDSTGWRAADAQPAAHEASLPQAARELPDVTGFFVVVLVTLGLFVVPVGATIMQGPAIFASLISGR
jgi:hypothetical protein